MAFIARALQDFEQDQVSDQHLLLAIVNRGTEAADRHCVQIP